MSAYPPPGGGATGGIGPFDRGYKLMAQRRVSTDPPKCVSHRQVWFSRMMVARRISMFLPDISTAEIREDAPDVPLLVSGHWHGS